MQAKPNFTKYEYIVFCDFGFFIVINYFIQCNEISETSLF